MDTLIFDDLTAAQYKQQTQANWTQAPCGSSKSNQTMCSREFFEQVERHRYSSHPWILQKIKRLDLAGKQVLEVGYGMGTDHLAMARQGGVMSGIDLTARNREVTAKRFELYGESSSLTVGDAEQLPYDDDSFDVVYSFGVVHHTPDTTKAVSEIYRVLKPGGRCWVTVYHKHSVQFWWSVFVCRYLIRGGVFRRTLKQQLSLIEHPHDNSNLIVRVYTPKEFKRLFSGFSACGSQVLHLLPQDISVLGRLCLDPERPRGLLDHLGRRWGWYVAVEAQK